MNAQKQHTDHHQSGDMSQISGNGFSGQQITNNSTQFSSLNDESANINNLSASLNSLSTSDLQLLSQLGPDLLQMLQQFSASSNMDLASAIRVLSMMSSNMSENNEIQIDQAVTVTHNNNNNNVINNKTTNRIKIFANGEEQIQLQSNPNTKNQSLGYPTISENSNETVPQTQNNNNNSTKILQQQNNENAICPHNSVSTFATKNSLLESNHQNNNNVLNSVPSGVSTSIASSSNFSSNTKNQNTNTQNSDTNTKANIINCAKMNSENHNNIASSSDVFTFTSAVPVQQNNSENIVAAGVVDTSNSNSKNNNNNNNNMISIILELPEGMHFSVDNNNDGNLSNYEGPTRLEVTMNKYMDPFANMIPNGYSKIEDVDEVSGKKLVRIIPNNEQNNSNVPNLYKSSTSISIQNPNLQVNKSASVKNPVNNHYDVTQTDPLQLLSNILAIQNPTTDNNNNNSNYNLSSSASHSDNFGPNNNQINFYNSHQSMNQSYQGQNTFTPSGSNSQNGWSNTQNNNNNNNLSDNSLQDLQKAIHSLRGSLTDMSIKNQYQNNTGTFDPYKHVPGPGPGSGISYHNNSNNNNNQNLNFGQNHHSIGNSMGYSQNLQNLSNSMSYNQNAFDSHSSQQSGNQNQFNSSFAESPNNLYAESPMNNSNFGFQSPNSSLPGPSSNNFQNFGNAMNANLQGNFGVSNNQFEMGSNHHNHNYLNPNYNSRNRSNTNSFANNYNNTLGYNMGNHNSNSTNFSTSPNSNSNLPSISMSPVPSSVSNSFRGNMKSNNWGSTAKDIDRRIPSLTNTDKSKRSSNLAVKYGNNNNKSGLGKNAYGHGKNSAYGSSKQQQSSLATKKSEATVTKVSPLSKITNTPNPITTTAPTTLTTSSNTTTTKIFNQSISELLKLKIPKIKIHARHCEIIWSSPEGISDALSQWADINRLMANKSFDLGKILKEIKNKDLKKDEDLKLLRAQRLLVCREKEKVDQQNFCQNNIKNCENGSNGLETTNIEVPSQNKFSSTPINSPVKNSDHSIEHESSYSPGGSPQSGSSSLEMFSSKQSSNFDSSNLSAITIESLNGKKSSALGSELNSLINYRIHIEENFFSTSGVCLILNNLKPKTRYILRVVCRINPNNENNKPKNNIIAGKKCEMAQGEYTDGLYFTTLADRPDPPKIPIIISFSGTFSNSNNKNGQQTEKAGYIANMNEKDVKSLIKIMANSNGDLSNNHQNEIKIMLKWVDDSNNGERITEYVLEQYILSVNENSKLENQMLQARRALNHSKNNNQDQSSHNQKTGSLDTKQLQNSLNNVVNKFAKDLQFTEVYRGSENMARLIANSQNRSNRQSQKNSSEKQKCRYSKDSLCLFRVKAVNKIGVSNPSEILRVKFVGENNCENMLLLVVGFGFFYK